MRVKVMAAIGIAAALWAGDAPFGGARTFRWARAAAAQDWRAEFDDVCARTQDAMALGSDELRSLVARCDRLKPALDALDESVRRVYARRLEACRALYQFVLDSRGADDVKG